MQKKHSVNLFTSFPPPPKNSETKHVTVLYIFIAVSYISFLASSFLLPTHRAAWSSAVSLSQYHIAEFGKKRCSSSNTALIIRTPSPQTSVPICHLNFGVFEKRLKVFGKKDGKSIIPTLHTWTDFACCIFKSSVDKNKRFSISNSFFKLALASALIASKWNLKGPQKG